MITIFNFFNYTNNPIVKYTVNQYKDKQVLTLDDCMPDIMKLRHSKFCYENNLRSRIGNQLRLYYASISDDFIYVDADSLVYNIDDLEMGNCAPASLNYNDGSYFRANKETDWVKYYVDLYQTNTTIGDIGNEMVYSRYKYKVPTQKLNFVHFYVSCFNKFARNNPDLTEILYTRNRDYAFNKYKGPIWLFDENYGRVTNTRIFHTGNIIPFDVFKEQLQYSLQRELKFTEV